jgi:hypothetical protein
MRSKLKEPGLWRGWRVWCVTTLQRLPLWGNSPDWCGACCPLRKSERAGPTENPPPPTLYMACDRKLIGIFDWRRTILQTTAWRDFSLARVVCMCSKTGWRGGCGRGATAWLLTKIRQNGRQNVIFWGHVRSTKRSGRHFCRNRSKKEIWST